MFLLNMIALSLYQALTVTRNNPLELELQRGDVSSVAQCWWKGVQGALLFMTWRFEGGKLVKVLSLKGNPVTMLTQGMALREKPEFCGKKTAENRS